eukprot:scaffold1770_cov375-Prasinococcus_capsulatus_cf.AAC.31
MGSDHNSGVKGTPLPPPHSPHPAKPRFLRRLPDGHFRTHCYPFLHSGRVPQDTPPCAESSRPQRVRNAEAPGGARMRHPCPGRPQWRRPDGEKARLYSCRSSVWQCFIHEDGLCWALNMVCGGPCRRTENLLSESWLRAWLRAVRTALASSAARRGRLDTSV